jgi:hypothetical protein
MTYPRAIAAKQREYRAEIDIRSANDLEAYTSRADR